ncbi:phage head-tail connector protein [Paenisporosarcina cavernae]|uniref:phage head-tail connector protein n=1 Tax=Paenisporosarcina cavernae TaxID=2320858 RepID=UPI0013C525B4|nr:phage head-tail connector protein [Paenisporosarcina cavernae]
MILEYIPTTSEIEEIKGILQWTDTKHDVYLQTMMPMIFEDVQIQTNNDFGGILEDGTIRIPGGVKIYMAKVIEMNMQKASLKSRSMGSVSYSYNLEVPESVKRLIRPYRRAKFRAF